MTSLIELAPPAALADLRRLAQEARGYARRSRAENTLRAYDGAWRRYVVWCRDRGIDPTVHAEAPAKRVGAVVALYIAHLATIGRATSTIALARAAIIAGYAKLGVAGIRDVSSLAEVWEGVRRTHGAPPRRAAALAIDNLRSICDSLGVEPIDVRDRAMLLVTFGAALRRSEAVALDIGNVTFEERGIVVLVAGGKTDQHHEGKSVGVPGGQHPSTCAVRAVQAWLTMRGDVEPHAPLFVAVSRWGYLGGRLSGDDVRRVLRKRAAAAGASLDGLSAHSLRAGLATAAARRGKSDRSIARQGRWRSRRMLDAYIREGQLFDADNAARGIGL